MSDQDPQPQTPHSELATFGEELRREREIRGISLKEIADATKISKRFLEAIERNDHKTLPAPVFTRGFVREYARYLGLNSDEMVNRYNYAAAGDDRIEKPPAHPAAQPLVESPKKPRAKRGIPPVFLRIDGSFIFVLLLVGALGAVAWWAVQFKQRRDAEARLAEAAPPPVAAAPKTAAPTPEPQPAAAGGETLKLVIDFRERCWVELHRDGERVLYDTYAAGTQQTFDAKEIFHFETIGNEDALTLTLNGVAVAVPSGREPVKDFDLTRETLQQSAPSQP
jgi:cytoskeletal protein RodZ